MYLKPLKFNNYLINCDKNSKYTFKNIYKSNVFNKLQIKFSNTFLNKFMQKNLKIILNKVKMYFICLFLNGTFGYANTLFTLNYNKNKFLIVNLLHLHYTKSFLYTIEISYFLNYLFKNMFKTKKYFLKSIKCVKK